MTVHVVVYLDDDSNRAFDVDGFEEVTVEADGGLRLGDGHHGDMVTRYAPTVWHHYTASERPA